MAHSKFHLLHAMFLTFLNQIMKIKGIFNITSRLKVAHKMITVINTKTPFLTWNNTILPKKLRVQESKKNN